MVERSLCMREVMGSNPIISTYFAGSRPCFWHMTWNIKVVPYITRRAITCTGSHWSHSRKVLQSGQKNLTCGSLSVVENAIYDAWERLSTDATRSFAGKYRGNCSTSMS